MSSYYIKRLNLSLLVSISTLFLYSCSNKVQTDTMLHSANQGFGVAKFASSFTKNIFLLVGIFVVAFIFFIVSAAFE